MNSSAACYGNGICSAPDTCTCNTQSTGPDCRVSISPSIPQNCYDISVLYPNAMDGMYTIKPWTTSIQVYCDMNRGGYTTFVRRVVGGVSFDTVYSAYVAGFGNINGDHWLGLNNINTLALAPTFSELRIDFSIGTSNYYRVYQNFFVDTSASNYVMKYSGGKYGNVCDAFATVDPSDKAFSTTDKSFAGTCPTTYRGGWWYNAASCTASLPTGGFKTTTPQPMFWGCLSNTALDYNDMKVRRVFHCTSYSKYY
jgi:ficolin